MHTVCKFHMRAIYLPRQVIKSLKLFISKLIHLSILCPTTPLPGKGGEWWGFDKFPTCGVQRVFKSPPRKVGYSAVETKLILWTVKSPTIVGRFFKSNPPPGRGAVGLNIDRCIIMCDLDWFSEIQSQL